MGIIQTHKRTILLILLAVAAVLLALVVWRGTGPLRGTPGYRVSGTPTPDSPTLSAVELFRSAARTGGETTATCFREKLGADRYAAVRLSPQSITPEEQFMLLPCYQ